jgi:hypothetical protein
MEVVTSMQSVEGEVVNFPKTVRPRGLVEQWLTAVEQAMYDAVKYHLKVRFLILVFLFRNSSSL